MSPGQQKLGPETRTNYPELRTPSNERVLETQEIEDVADAGPGGGFAIARVGLAINEAVLEAEEVKDVQHPISRCRVAVGVGVRFGLASGSIRAR